MATRTAAAVGQRDSPFTALCSITSVEHYRGVVKRIALGVLLVAVIVIGALGLHVLRGEDGRFYHDDFSDGRPPALPKGVREVDFETADHLALKAWYLGPDAPSRTLVLLHGTGATRAQLSPLARVVASHGIGVVLSDYRGFAGLPGRPSDVGLTLDGLAVVQAARQLSAPGAAIVIGGFSLGAPGAIRVAAQDHGVAGVVVLGAYTKVADLPNDRRRFPRNLLFHARLNAEAVISRGQAPVSSEPPR